MCAAKKKASKSPAQGAPSAAQSNAKLSAKQPAEKKPSPLSRYSAPMETVHRSQLVNAEYNPRRIDAAAKRKLRNSLKQFGVVQPIVWNKKTGNIVGGHQRLDTLDQLEGSQDYSLDVVVVNLTDKRERELNVALNNPEMQGFYDVERLFALIDDKSVGFDIEAAGFETVTLEILADQAGLETPIFDGMFDPAGLDMIHNVGDQVDEMILESNLSAAEDRRQKKAEKEQAEAESQGDQPEEQAGDTDVDQIALIKARKQDYAASAAAVENAQDFYVTLVFANDEEKFAFMNAHGLDPYNLYVSVTEAEEAFGFSMAEIIKKHGHVAGADTTKDDRQEEES